MASYKALLLWMWIMISRAVAPNLACSWHILGYHFWWYSWK